MWILSDLTNEFHVIIQIKLIQWNELEFQIMVILADFGYTV
jgi:hypothetical protein